MKSFANWPLPWACPRMYCATSAEVQLSGTVAVAGRLPGVPSLSTDAPVFHHPLSQLPGDAIWPIEGAGLSGPPCHCCCPHQAPISGSAALRIACTSPAFHFRAVLVCSPLPFRGTG